MALRRLRGLAFPADEESDGETKEKDDAKNQDMLGALSSFIEHGVQTPSPKTRATHGESDALSGEVPLLLSPPTPSRTAGSDLEADTLPMSGVQDPEPSSGPAAREGDLIKDAVSAGVDAADISHVKEEITGPKASVEAAASEGIELGAGSGNLATSEAVELKAGGGNDNSNNLVQDEIEDLEAGSGNLATSEAVELKAGSGNDIGSNLVQDKIEDPKASVEAAASEGVELGAGSGNLATSEAVELKAGGGNDNSKNLVQDEIEDPKAAVEIFELEASSGNDHGSNLVPDEIEVPKATVDVATLEGGELEDENQSARKSPLASAKRRAADESDVDEACDSEAKRLKMDEMFNALRASLEELINTTDEADAKTDVLDWARTLGRSRVTTKDSAVTMWFTVDKRKANDVETPYVCLKLSSHTGATTQVSSLKSDYSMLFKHGLVFKAILLTAATLESKPHWSVWPALRDAALEWV
jgi:hypothetical protein